MTAKKFPIFALFISFILLSLYRVPVAAAKNRKFSSALATTIMMSSAAKVAEKATVIEAPIPDWPTTGHPHILISGGAGYIGTHTIVCLLEGRRPCWCPFQQLKTRIISYTFLHIQCSVGSDAPSSFNASTSQLVTMSRW